MPLQLSADQARRLTLSLQGLACTPRRRLSADGLTTLIEDLGFVQLDSISTVQRAHHMILFSRAESYRPERLRRLVEDDARLFEHWTHDASVIPTAFYPYWRHRFAREEGGLADKFCRWFGAEHLGDLDRVLEHIRNNGPVMARDFADGNTAGRQGWWDWHTGKAALEFHWRAGRLAVARRQGFQKVYDLAERVIPEVARAEMPSADAFVDWACRSALDRLGFASPGEIARFWDLVTIAEAKAWCEAQQDGDIRTVVVEAADGSRPRPVFARGDIEDLLSNLDDPPGRVRALSPFDPVLRDRKRLMAGFGFDYRIEIFVPAAKRKYGYYVFPLLDRDRFVGRIDMKADRDRDTLDVTALWLEPGCRPSKGRLTRLEGELDRMRRFAEVSSVTMADGYLRT